MEEIWKPVPGYEKYIVSNLGGIKRFIKNNWRCLNGHVNKDGYKNISLFKNSKEKRYLLHQIVAMAFLNHKPNGYALVVNHKDFNRSNNKVENLEVIPMRENVNRKHLKHTSKYTGVYWCKNRLGWIACIRTGKKGTYLGKFDNEEDASNAYQKALKDIII